MSPEFKSHVFSSWFQIECDLYQHNSKINNSRKFKLGILDACHSGKKFKTFHEDMKNSRYDTKEFKLITVYR